MKKSVIITIPEPCHEDWAKMTPTEKGKFCDVCTKEVVDFSESSDESLVTKVKAGQQLCGRFKTSQLNREIKLERRSGTTIWPYAASLLLPLTVLGSQKMEAMKPSVFNKPAISLGIGSNIVGDKAAVIVSGQITDTQGTPLSYVEITNLTTGERFASDREGNYKLKCSSEDTLLFQKENRVPFYQLIGTKQHYIVNVRLEQDLSLLSQPALLLGKFTPQVTITEAQEMTVGDIAIIEEIEEHVEKAQDSTLMTMSGTITNENGLPLQKVKVAIKGSPTATLSNETGAYLIQAQPNQIIIFSHEKYESREIRTSTINNKLDLQMIPIEYHSGEIQVMGRISVQDATHSISQKLKKTFQRKNR